VERPGTAGAAAPRREPEPVLEGVGCWLRTWRGGVLVSVGRALRDDPFAPFTNLTIVTAFSAPDFGAIP
jgi:hypothetical protein